MLPATPQRTALTRLLAPTPMMHALMQWVVETGMPRWLAARMVAVPAVSAAKPCSGEMRMILVPIVLMIFLPPAAVPSAIAAGTMAGGKRIIKTMGTKIIRIQPIQGFAAETAGALTILGASQFGVPVSTTHCINACIMGVGASKRISAVRWGVAGNIVTAWVLTLPLSAAFAWGTFKVLTAVLE